MLTQSKQEYIYFFILMIKLLCYTGNLFCTTSDTQKNSLRNRYIGYSYHSDNSYQTITDKNHTKFTLNSEKKDQLTTASPSGESAPWSNAFNFKKVWGTTVDPRTGILSTFIKTGSMLSNLGHGPDINLNVNYNSSALANPDDLGRGWSWNLTHFNPVTHQLITSFGQNFYLKKQFNGHWKPEYHKLHDIFIQGDMSTHFVITYPSGLREILNHAGYETRLEQQDGWSVHFSYVPGTHLLKSISDDEEHIIKLQRIKSYIAVISQGSTGQSVVVLIHKKNSEIHSITLPYFNHHVGHGIDFHYRNHLIISIDYPTGLKNWIIYNCNDEIKVPANYTSSEHTSCVVVKQMTDPGFSQPVMINRYRYGKANINEHNYLGFNAGLNITDNFPKDRLFEAPVSYTYKTEENNGLIREIRTYNKYHLMTDEQQISNRTGHVLSAVHYFFCRTDQYDGCAHSSFTDLPVTYSLPLKIITRVFGETADKPATTTVTSHYDEQGRITRQTDAWGRVTVNNYCPLTGNNTCPAASVAWPFSTLTESTIQYPADTGTGTAPLLPVTTWNYYRRELNHNGKGYISVLDHQTEQSGNQQITITHHYYHNTKDLLTYGLLKQLVLTGQLNETNSTDAVIKDYYYLKSSDNYTKTTYSAIELSENKRLLSSYTTTSLFTNQILMVTDAEKKDQDRYYYDSWDRLIKTERAVGTGFAASTHYSYTLSENINQILITAVNGLQQKTIFDGAGRTLKSFTEAIDKIGKQQPGLWWPAEKICYDEYGRIARQSSYIIDESGHATALNTTQDYDDTGRAVRTHLPDGGMTVMHYDDSNRCVISYKENIQGQRSAVSVARANVLSKPVRQWILPATNVTFPSVKSLCLSSNKQPEARVSRITYDGFGRQITIQDTSGRIVRQRYDSLGRLTDTIDPAGNRTHSVYNLTGQTVQSWVYPVSGGHYLLSSTGYNRAGQLIWHAGEDGKRTVYTYTTDGQMATITTPNRHIFSWQYNLLNLPVSQSADNKQQWYIFYDPVTLSVKQKTDITGIKTYSYSDDGLTQQLTFIGKNNYPDYQLQWQYDNNRRTVWAIDISGNKKQISYDWLGRITHIVYHSRQNNHTEVLSAFTYDDFSRIQQINYGSGMQRIFHYDAWGHQDEITDILKKQLLSQWKIAYDISGNIILLSQKAEKKQTGIQHYHYDVLDNLVSMQCQGSSGLPLCPHDTSPAGLKLPQAPVITRQDYTFTPLNRLSGVQETLQSAQQQQTISKTTRYYYTDTSVPLRLQSISTAWNQQKPVDQNLTYDDMGNMTVDGQNNHLTYNLLNEVTHVILSTGKQSNYSYDGSGQKIMEKSLRGISYFFYCDNTLMNEKIISPQQDIHTIGYLGIAKTTDGIISEYYENSYKGDVSGILQKDNKDQYQFKQRNIYSPYGMVWHKTSNTRSLYQQTLQGFNGERTDAATGWQFLGAGNRTYNPTGRYFFSEDAAGDGYRFGNNNPVMNTDPSGNSPQWMGEIFKWTGYISTLGLSAIHQRWANITAAIMQAGFTAAAVGSAVAGAGGAALAGVVAGTAAIGSIPVVAAAMPANKGLNIAGKVTGMAEMAVSVAAAAFSLIPVAAEEVIGENIGKIRIPLNMLSLKATAQDSVLPDLDEASVVSDTVSSKASSATLHYHPEPVSSVSAFLKTSPDYFEGRYTDYLNLNDKSAVERTLRILSASPFSNNIACDTNTILLAYHLTNEKLDIQILENFLSIRSSCADKATEYSLQNPYFLAMKTILEPVKKYHTFFNMGTYSLSRFVTQIPIGQYVVIIGYSHMTIMQRILSKRYCASNWKVFMLFDDGSIDTEIVKNSRLKYIIPDADPTQFRVYGYMHLK